MKISVSLPDEDVEFLDEYAKSPGIGSRSARCSACGSVAAHYRAGPGLRESLGGMGIEW